MKALFIDSNHPIMHQTLEANGITCDLFYDKSADELKALIPNYEAIVIRSKFKITKEIIDSTSKLKCIGRAGAGMENIDVEYAESKGIKCVHAPEGNKDAAGEHAIAMLLSLFNNLNKADKEVRKGIWLREENRGIELGGKTVGIIGYGNMGSSFAKRLQGFDCNILVYDKYKKGFGTETIKETTLDEIFEKADVVSLHTPLTSETNYFINSSFISNFKNNIYIINTARGKCLNTADLVEALKNGKVLGACLDVLEYEKVSFENIDTSNIPAPLSYLFESEKVILSPHIAGWTHESNVKIGKILAEKIASVLKTK